jgi:hypothetical protein
MKTLLITVALLSSITAAAAQQVRIPTEEEKIAALKLAYRLNGNSMEGLGRMIDLTNPKVLEEAAALIASETPPLNPPVIVTPAVPR